MWMVTITFDPYNRVKNGVALLIFDNEKDARAAYAIQSPDCMVRLCQVIEEAPPLISLPSGLLSGHTNG